MKKSRKSKIVLLSVLGLATVSLATVGFASWVISGETPADDQNITAIAGEVVDKTLSASIVSKDCDLSIRFDNLKQGSEGLNIPNGSATDEQDLDFTIVTTITAGDKLNGNLAGVKYEFTYASVLEQAITKQYVAFAKGKTYTPTITFTADKEATITDNTTNALLFTDEKTLKITSNFSFTWGQAFGGYNPGKLDPNATNTVETSKKNIDVLKDFVTLIGTSTAQKLITVKVTPVAK